MSRIVYVVGKDRSVGAMFESMGWRAEYLIESTSGDEIPDLICFTGGSDVSPYLYGEENISSHCDPIRDEFEKQVYSEFVGKAPMVGICRGGQFLNVMNGGKMIQHIDGHSGDREIFLHAKVPGVLKVREDHHQGIDSRGKGSVLAVDMYDDNEEIVWFSDTRCLCFQPHPEWGHEPTKELFFELIKECIGL